MKFIFVSPTYDSLGGGEVWLNRLANALADGEHDVSVIGLRPPAVPLPMNWNPRIDRRFAGATPEFTQAPGVAARFARTVVDEVTRGWRPHSWFERAVADSDGRLESALSETDAAQADLIVCSDIHTAGLVDSLVLVGPPRVVVHHSSFAALSHGSRRRLRALARRADALVALTPEDAELFKESGFPVVEVIRNPGPGTTGGSDHDEGERRDLVWLGRMSREKGVDQLIDAWSMLGARRQDSVLRLYGDGPERSALQTRVERLGLQDSVAFMGTTSRSTTVLEGRIANVLPSRQEGWGLVIAEASSVHTTTIAFDVSAGVRAQIKHGETGLLVPAGSVKGLARGLHDLISDRSLAARLGGAAAEQAKTSTPAEIARAWIELARRLGADARTDSR